MTHCLAWNLNLQSAFEEGGKSLELWQDCIEMKLEFLGEKLLAECPLGIWGEITSKVLFKNLGGNYQQSARWKFMGKLLAECPLNLGYIENWGEGKLLVKYPLKIWGEINSKEQTTH